MFLHVNREQSPTAVSVCRSCSRVVTVFSPPSPTKAKGSEIQQLPGPSSPLDLTVIEGLGFPRNGETQMFLLMYRWEAGNGLPHWVGLVTELGPGRGGLLQVSLV